MTLPKTRRPAKKQRGISLSPDLYQRIQDDADKLGLSWNDVAERVLARAFSVSMNGSNSLQNGSGKARLTLKEVPDDDD